MPKKRAQSPPRSAAPAEGEAGSSAAAAAPAEPAKEPVAPIEVFYCQGTFQP